MNAIYYYEWGDFNVFVIVYCWVVWDIDPLALGMLVGSDLSSLTKGDLKGCERMWLFCIVNSLGMKITIFRDAMPMCW